MRKEERDAIIGRATCILLLDAFLPVIVIFLTDEMEEVTGFKGQWIFKMVGIFE